MKKIVIAVLLFALSVTFACAAGARGNENIISIEKDLVPFDRIYIGGTALVNYYRSDAYHVSVRIDSNLEEYIDILVDGSRLSVRPKQGHRIFPTEFIVDVYSPGLTGISLSGAVQFSGKDRITARDLDLRISGSGKVIGVFECETFSANISGAGEIDATIICESFSANISGSGRITLLGSCNDLTLGMSGSGNFEGYDFQSNSANIRTSGSSRIDIWVLEYLKVQMSGSGWLRYRGNPFIESNTSGSGYIGRGE